jgi:SWI/SNF-related matrix-associated actin-dependent regulator of chromatin subfamily A3
MQQNMPVLNENLGGGLETAKDHVQRFTLSVKSDPRVILLSFEDGSEFGYLKENMTRPFENLISKSTVEFEGIGETSKIREQVFRASKPEEAVVQVSSYSLRHSQ